MSDTINDTPRSGRLHIGIYGRRNAGKSSLINAITGHETAIVSETAGTTTDPVYKSMEIHGLGPCVLIDTAGFDDVGPMGELRVEKTRLALEKTDMALLVVTDGDDLSVEKKWAASLKAHKTPFIVVLNTSLPDDPETRKMADALSEKYGASVIVCDVRNMTETDASEMFAAALMEFPLVGADFVLSRWLGALPADSSLVRDLTARLRDCCADMTRMGDYRRLCDTFDGGENFKKPEMTGVSMGEGKIVCSVEASDGVFYKALSEECGVEIADDRDLMTRVKAMAVAKREYDRLEKALHDVGETGYGVVIPSQDEMTLEEPEIVRRGSQFGVRLKATAPSLHIMRVDIESEVCPIVGTEQQSEDLVKYLLSEFESDPASIWETNMFGKSLHSLVSEGLSNKLCAMPPDTQKKMRRALSRIVNEGKGGILCILL